MERTIAAPEAEAQLAALKAQPPSPERDEAIKRVLAEELEELLDPSHADGGSDFSTV